VHDFLLAKEIIDEVLQIAKEKNLVDIRFVSLEIGSISLAHDGHPEHIEDISLENLKFGLKSIARDTLLKDVKFNIQKVSGENWKIISIDA
jgi:Zn finger protein HypA/HybF involved in hydrogenase expression